MPRQHLTHDELMAHVRLALWTWSDDAGADPWLCSDLPPDAKQRLRTERDAKRADLDRITDDFGLGQKHAPLLRKVLYEAEAAYWRIQAAPSPAIRKQLRGQATKIEGALKALKERHDSWTTTRESDEPETVEQIFGDAPRRMPVWQLRAGLRAELQRIEAEMAMDHRGSSSRRDDLRAAAVPLLLFWTKVAKGNPNISSRGRGRLSRTGKFLLATLQLIDPTISPSLILKLSQ